MARVRLAKPESVEDPAVAGIFEWVTQMEGSVPNHFYVELNFPAEEAADMEGLAQLALRPEKWKDEVPTG